ncbi:MAG: hypothetical protein WC291_07580 [Thermodesulfovibrionales bacterium]
MVIHENIGIKLKAASLHVGLQLFKVDTPILIAEKDILPLVASDYQVIEGSFILYPGLSCHNTSNYTPPLA